MINKVTLACDQAVQAVRAVSAPAARGSDGVDLKTAIAALPAALAALQAALVTPDLTRIPPPSPFLQGKGMGAPVTPSAAAAKSMPHLSRPSTVPPAAPAPSPAVAAFAALSPAQQEAILAAIQSPPTA
jgi:hypothetical protein